MRLEDYAHEWLHLAVDLLDDRDWKQAMGWFWAASVAWCAVYQYERGK